MKKCFQLLLSTAVFSSANWSAQAQEENTSGGLYLDVMPVVGWLDSDRGTDSPAYGARMALGYGQRGPWFIEGQLFGVRAEMEAPFADGDFDTAGLGIDIVYGFGNRQRYTPFLLFGVGTASNNPPFSSSQTNGFLNVGAGFVSHPLNDRGLKIRGELRYLRDYFSDNPLSSNDTLDDWHLGIGFSFPLGSPAAKTVPKPVPDPVRDEDGDGVPDSADKCPGTLAGAIVDDDGCAIPEQTITLQDVHFEFDSAILTPEAGASLNNVVQALNNQPGSQVEISGHTDSVGSDAYNLTLSLERAEAVRNYLVELGIAAERLATQGYGETQPITDNRTEAGRALNRRVEMRFR